MIDLQALRTLNHIIEHDKVSSTYKYALLKGVINVVQRYEHLIQSTPKHAVIPLGLLVEQWVMDYLPFVFMKIRQQHRGNVLNGEIEALYQRLFEALALQSQAQWPYAYLTFQRELQTPSSPSISELLAALFALSAKTITTMPMKFLGDTPYALFEPERTRFTGVKPQHGRLFSRAFMVGAYGTFRMPIDLYEVLRYLGQSLLGSSTVIQKWREKTRLLNPDRTPAEDLFEKLSGVMIDPRDTSAVRAILPTESACVWSGRALHGKQFDVDHLLPYSIWGNNDLWNLLPADKKINLHITAHPATNRAEHPATWREIFSVFGF